MPKTTSFDSRCLGRMGPRTDAFAGECESVLHNFTIFHLMLVSCRHRRRRQRRRDVCLINCHLFDVSLRAAGSRQQGLNRDAARTQCTASPLLLITLRVAGRTRTRTRSRPPFDGNKKVKSPNASLPSSPSVPSLPGDNDNKT